MRLTCATCRRSEEAARSYANLSGFYLRIRAPWRIERVWISHESGGFMTDASFCSDVCAWRFEPDEYGEQLEKK